MTELWAHSPVDFRAHLLADDGTLGFLLAQCGHVMPLAARVDTAPRGASCAACLLTLDPLLMPAPRPPVLVPPQRRRH